jgi:hypothetical protein
MSAAALPKPRENYGWVLARKRLQERNSKGTAYMRKMAMQNELWFSEWRYRVMAFLQQTSECLRPFI